MMKWEYKTGAVGGHNENAYGADGWEMVGIFDRMAIYKRPMPATTSEDEPTRGAAAIPSGEPAPPDEEMENAEVS
jgi:hypothetical protein